MGFYHLLQRHLHAGLDVPITMCHPLLMTDRPTAVPPTAVLPPPPVACAQLRSTADVVRGQADLFQKLANAFTAIHGELA
jgi:hypothetical protein